MSSYIQLISFILERLIFFDPTNGFFWPFAKWAFSLFFLFFFLISPIVF